MTAPVGAGLLALESLSSPTLLLESLGAGLLGIESLSAGPSVLESQSSRALQVGRMRSRITEDPDDVGNSCPSPSGGADGVVEMRSRPCGDFHKNPKSKALDPTPTLWRRWSGSRGGGRHAVSSPKALNPKP